jgi:hypothetical protein
MISARYFSAAAAVFLLSAATRLPAVTLAAPFGDHMVLQQGVPVPIWGSGCPGGDSVKVNIAGQTVNAKSDWSGKWAVTLAPMKAGGPYQVLIQVGGSGPMVPSSAANSKGGNELNDVMVGDVWLVAGASNAQAAPIPDARSTWIGIYRNSRWALAAPELVTGQVAAVWSLARSLFEKGRTPIGLVDASYASMAPSAMRGVIWDGTAYPGPIYQSMAREGGAIRLRFQAADGGLTAKAGTLAGFQIAGEDRKFVPASARIEGEEVVVSSPGVATPVAVRYGYAGDPPASLCDRAGLSAAPFRTDSW